MNKIYQQILLAVDLGVQANWGQAETIAYQALRVCRQFKSTLSMVYAVKPIPINCNGQIVMDLGIVYSRIEEEAQNRMHHFAINFGIPPARQYALIGQAHEVIPRMAFETRTDLIIVGKHKRNAFAHFFSSKVTRVLENTCVDVLAVHID